MDKLSKTIMIQILYKLIEIRIFEEMTVKLGRSGKIGGYIHPYIGEEAVAVGACMAINTEDYLTSTHRGHGHCIAKGSSLDKMMAELFGKVTGYCKGRGGSMHIADAKLGILGANGIVGGGIPIAVGAGLSCKKKKDGRVVICFFGDGAVNNGVFHEALNMASIYKLPVIFICENNMFANSTNVKDSTSIENIGDRSHAYSMPGYVIDGSDVIEIFSTVKKAVGYARDGHGPSLIEAKTYRFYGHHSNDPAVYRNKEEENYYKKEKDPVANFKNKLLKEKIIDEKELAEIETKIKNTVDQAIKFAEESPYPNLDEFLEQIKEL
jgi:TPP-dependent pyruvate/acetoin dehydrogenase alpha subunit